MDLEYLKQTKKQINNELLTDINEELTKAAEQDTSQETSLGNVEANDFPSLANIILQEDNKTEAEWILVYALYCSEFGSKLFTEEDLRMKYDETKRVTDARKRTLKQT